MRGQGTVLAGAYRCDLNSGLIENRPAWSRMGRERRRATATNMGQINLNWGGGQCQPNFCECLIGSLSRVEHLGRSSASVPQRTAHTIKRCAAVNGSLPKGSTEGLQVEFHTRNLLDALLQFPQHRFRPI